MHSLKLNSGYSMPVLGLGTWLSKPGEVAEAVKAALSNGYHMIDCAQGYQNQKEIGPALKELFDGGVVKREDVFITSKVWNTFHSFELARRSVDQTLEELGLAYIDLMLIHWPTGYKEGGEIFPKNEDGTKMLYSDVDYLDTWKALESKLAEGKIRSLGLSNFNPQQIQRIIANGKVRPAVLQVELHPYFQQKELVAFCAKESIVVTAYSPLANPSMPFRKEGDPNVLHDPTVTSIAKKHSRSNAQVVLRFLIQKHIVVIPKSVNAERIKDNGRVFDFSLTEEEMGAMEGLDRNRRFLDTSARDGDHPYHPWAGQQAK